MPMRFIGSNCHRNRGSVRVKWLASNRTVIDLAFLNYHKFLFFAYGKISLQSQCANLCFDLKGKKFAEGAQKTQ
jgi:hypothetical protein